MLKARRAALFTLHRKLDFCYFPRLMPSPEELAREKIDKVLTECGWILQNRSTINLSAGQGIAIREALLKGEYLGSARASRAESGASPDSSSNLNHRLANLHWSQLRIDSCRL